MSEENSAVHVPSCCASCGIAEIDDTKLVPCDGCDLVRYCSDECQEDHKLEHEEACKKRAAELRDKLLFEVPESSYRGDCPICMIPLSLDLLTSTVYRCCSKLVCKGCVYANDRREDEMRLAPSCPFCREPIPETDEEIRKQVMKRVEANDPHAICEWGVEQFEKRDFSGALEYFTKAATLGDAEAHYKLALMYQIDECVEKDDEKYIYHLGEAAVSGHPDARYFLGAYEWNSDNDLRAVKHWIIAATQGDDRSIKQLMKIFKEGFIKKVVLEHALRAHKAAVDATKTPLREEAEIYSETSDLSFS